jgi:hypothetical protein
MNSIAGRNESASVAAGKCERKQKAVSGRRSGKSKMRQKQNEAKEKRNGRNGKQGGGTARREQKGKDAGGNKKAFTAASKECVTEHG